jgi:hypothetical protein
MFPLYAQDFRDPPKFGLGLDQMCGEIMCVHADDPKLINNLPWLWHLVHTALYIDCI